MKIALLSQQCNIMNNNLNVNLWKLEINTNNLLNIKLIIYSVGVVIIQQISMFLLSFLSSVCNFVIKYVILTKLLLHKILLHKKGQTIHILDLQS